MDAGSRYNKFRPPLVNQMSHKKKSHENAEMCIRKVYFELAEEYMVVMMS
ncbi:hypothetical protein RND71_004822 [Anisodus tanguticus]|uniref:Uncharacterized protein n=1 Tax=Anisodus tanguticus TaxID=243964 RepID=A0AAE1SQ94_9SOLA|nr:hypothetical protein RND71_004822 [Anisodus tanguticus]